LAFHLELSRSGQVEIVQFLASAGVSGPPACNLTVFLVGAGTSDDVGSIGPVHGDGNVSGLQMRRLSGGQSRKAKTRNKEAALPNELSISFHFAPTTISFSPAETQENSLVWTLAAPSVPHKAAGQAPTMCARPAVAGSFGRCA